MRNHVVRAPQTDRYRLDVPQNGADLFTQAVMSWTVPFGSAQVLGDSIGNAVTLTPAALDRNDWGGSYNSSTGIWTPPFAGTYLLNAVWGVVKGSADIQSTVFQLVDQAGVNRAILVSNVQCGSLHQTAGSFLLQLGYNGILGIGLKATRFSAGVTLGIYGSLSAVLVAP